MTQAQRRVHRVSAHQSVTGGGAWTKQVSPLGFPLHLRPLTVLSLLQMICKRTALFFVQMVGGGSGQAQDRILANPSPGLPTAFVLVTVGQLHHLYI